MFLYHYYEKTIGPFKNLSDLPVMEAEKIIRTIKKNKPSSMAGQMDSKLYEKKIKL